MTWPDPRGGPGGHRTPPPPPSTAIYKIIDLFYSDFIQDWRIEKHENGLFWGGGGGGGGGEGVSEEVETLGEALPLLNYRLPRTVMICSCPIP